jgi:hypothetical protein
MNRFDCPNKKYGDIQNPINHQTLPPNTNHPALHLEKFSRMDTPQRAAVAGSRCFTTAVALFSKIAGG